MNFCTECGQKIEQSANFCPSCGFQLKSTSTNKHDPAFQVGPQSESQDFQVLIRHLLEHLDFWNIEIALPETSLPPYIQVSQDNGGWLLEASSENYTNPPINKKQISQLIDIGFSEPDETVCLNYWLNESSIDSAIEKLVEVFFGVFHFDYKESIRGITPDMNLIKYVSRNLSGSFTLLKVIK